jgi:serine/threonine-protein kinase
MARGDEKLEAVATSISDGMAVDWAAIEAEFGPGEGAVVRNLRILEGLARYSQPILETSDVIPESAGEVAPVDPSNRIGPPLTRWAHLERLQRIGEGAFGEVFRAWDPRLDREVALKLLWSDPDEEEPRVAVREGRLLARVRHPNVATVYGADRQDGRVGLWMEFVRGSSLAELLREKGAFGPAEAALIGVDVCRALAAVHRSGLLHGDIKAENVMREEGGRIVLMDFGISRELSRIAEEISISGTPLYMAPEVLNGDPADQKSDIYSLGVLLFHLVTREYPVEGKTFREIREAHHEGRIRLLRDVRPDLPAGFLQIVERAMAKDPAERFRSAGEMERALEGFRGHGVSPPPSPVIRWIVAAAIPAIVAIGIWLATRPGSYEIQAAFLRPSPAGVMEPLDSGDRVSVGDVIYLDIEASTDLHVYVLNEDEAGEVWLLFPLQGFDIGNPTPSGRKLRLPDEEVGWEITSAGGREHFLVMASPERLEDFEKEVASLPRPEPGKPLQLSAAALGKTRGAGGLRAPSPNQPGSESRGRFFSMARRLAQQPEKAKGVWIRQIDVENPGP